MIVWRGKEKVWREKGNGVVIDTAPGVREIIEMYRKRRGKKKIVEIDQCVERTSERRGWEGGGGINQKKK